MDGERSWEKRAAELIERARTLGPGATGQEKRALIEEIRVVQRERGVALLVPEGKTYRQGRGRLPGPGQRRRERQCLAGGACAGSGWVLGDDGRARRCRCRADRARARRRFHRFAPENLTLSLEAPPLAQLPEPVLAAATRFQEQLRAGHHPGLWIAGPPNTSKSSLAVYLATEAASRGLDVAFFPLNELLGRLWRLDGGQRKRNEPFLVDEIEALASRDLVVIDDLDGQQLERTRLVAQEADAGVRQLCSRDVDLLQLLLNELEQREGALVITTELDVRGLRRRLARWSRRDLLRSCLEAAHAGDPLAGEEGLIEVRAARIISRLRGLCEGPVLTVNGRGLPSDARASLGE